MTKKERKNSVLSKNGEFSVSNADVSKSEEWKSGPRKRYFVETRAFTVISSFSKL